MDNELVEAIVCPANAEGGEPWLGIEDDGTLTGLQQSTKCSMACRPGGSAHLAVGQRVQALEAVGRFVASSMGFMSLYGPEWMETSHFRGR